MPVKSKVRILQNFVAFSEYMNFTPRFFDFPKALESVLNDAKLESVVIFDIIPRSKGGLYLSSYVIQHASIPFSKTRVRDAGKKLIIFCFFVVCLFVVCLFVCCLIVFCLFDLGYLFVILYMLYNT